VLAPKSLESLESQEIHFKKRGERDTKDERVDVAASRPGVRDKEMGKIAAKAKPDAGWAFSALRKAPKPGAASSPGEHEDVASTRADLDKLEGAMRRSRSNANEMKVLTANANKKNLRAVKNQLVLVPRKKAGAEEALMELFARNRLDPVAGQAGTRRLGGLGYQKRLGKGGGSRGNFYRAGGNGEIVYLVTMDEGQLERFNKDLSGETRLAVAAESSPQFQNVRLTQIANWGLALDSRAVAEDVVVLRSEMMQTKAKGKRAGLGLAGTYEDGDKAAAKAAEEQSATDNKLALKKQGAEEPRQQVFAGGGDAYKAEAGKKTMARRVKALKSDPGKSAFEQKQKIPTGQQRALQVRRQVLVVVRLRSLPLAGLVAPAAKAAPKARKSAPAEATTESAK
ncbi:MAG: hypothetical protein QF662_04825, partial [Phycisphaerae bacterium]|nr:hypothetical protein [Phycisphaerae bacterium]